MNAPQLLADLNSAVNGGIAVVPAVFGPDVLRRANDAIDEVVALASDKALHHCARKIADLLRENDSFRALEMEVARLAANWLGEARSAHGTAGPWYVLRRANPDKLSGSHCRHFDSHVATIVVVLKTADAGDSNGDLLVYPRARAVPSAAGNVLQKGLQWIERRLPFGMRAAASKRHLAQQRCRRIPGVAGDVHVFNGFVLQHRNLEVAGGERRTLLIHHLDPGLALGASAVTRYVRGAAKAGAN